MMGRTGRIALAGIFVGVVVLALKTEAWWITGSAALYSDALETLVNVAAAGLAFWAVRIAAQPADADHTYGHTKAELFAAVIEGVLILLAALLIFRHAWLHWTQSTSLTAPLPGIALNLVASVVNGAWAWVLVRTGRTHRSPALAADGRHLYSDVLTSLAVVLGIVLALATGARWMDPVLAVLVGVYVLWQGVRMISSSANVLMDAAPDPAIVARMRELVALHAQGAIEAHDLRMRHAGPVSFLEFHLVVPGSMSVADAHAICDRIEDALRAEMEGLVVTIHLEPEEKAKLQGVPVL